MPLTLEILGAHGGAGAQVHCSCFRVGKHTLIDAGHLLADLSDELEQIHNLFLTHAHSDHIRDLPFLIDNVYGRLTQPLRIFAAQQTIDALTRHLFNGEIWPAFHTFNHPQLHQPAIEFIALEPYEHVFIENFSLTPVPANHTVPCYGYYLEANHQGVLISGDTTLNPELNRWINQTPNLHTLIIETSFPSALQNLAETSRHLTPALLEQQLAGIARPLNIYAYHLKPGYLHTIENELQALFAKPDTHTFGGCLQHGQCLAIHHAPPQIQLTAPTPPADSRHTQLKSLLKIAQALSAEHSLERLLEMILEEAMDFSQADAGTLYRYDENEAQLHFAVVKNRTLNLQLGGLENPIDWPGLPLYLPDGTPNRQMASALCALQKQAKRIDDLYRNTEFDFSGTRQFDAQTGYRSKSMLVVPLLNQRQELLGVLQLINKTDACGHPTLFSAQDEANAMALAAQAALSLSNALLIQQMEALFESFATAINKAFDEKCSFTGEHVLQVAELAQIISQAIHADTTTYPDVTYSPETLHTIKIAGLVHDVGKIATPEFILHKATKLETKVDRIELIALRMALLKQQSWTQRLETQLEQHHIDTQPLRAGWAEHNAVLDDELAFLQRINSGRQRLSEAEAEQIRAIAQRTYEHNAQPHPLLNADEVLNLCIKQGTLNERERQIIMDHARLSLEMLQTLPFPKKYGRIVDIAANHHEKLNGQGYPRGLTAKELTLEDQILVLADLYEALSSPKRPYKTPLTIAEVVGILCDMANRGEIDKTLLRFFFESGTYAAYNRYLRPEQLTDFSLTLDD